ncbi:MAG: tyrosine-type recombinase/integrase [Candidatus Thiodiazotropha taylori]|uniref:Tyrosine-type recombinase/integrase n=1 Tax=Candidatus Thiodiazotropha taylori TaxID=2792791 RepID=A0A9E4NIC8_9GAMM|nr:tyrosine-type recombinase/integrase [Candidatus Thiodiazotropha taylori]
MHDLRHTCAAWLVQTGVPLRTVTEILRHKDIRTTMIYAHLAPDDARSGGAALEQVMERGKNVVTDGKKVAKSVNS